jgi:hypothetical protein
MVRYHSFVPPTSFLPVARLADKTLDEVDMLVRQTRKRLHIRNSSKDSCNIRVHP